MRIRRYKQFTELLSTDKKDGIRTRLNKNYVNQPNSTHDKPSIFLDAHLLLTTPEVQTTAQGTDEYLSQPLIRFRTDSTRWTPGGRLPRADKFTRLLESIRFRFGNGNKAAVCGCSDLTAGRVFCLASHDGRGWSSFGTLPRNTSSSWFNPLWSVSTTAGGRST